MIKIIVTTQYHEHELVRLIEKFLNDKKLEFWSIDITKERD